ncbi:MAG: Sensor histidine kinase YycG [Candidatus Latescibacteria bacterium ADurb.Bin168]|nr:MAG: Sensor histidine kinase YycG [Candidatus Latescibacteria bacterium ADurb.Bin168]
MEKRLRITLKAAPDLPPAYADPNRMEQVLMNLLGNAVKFTPENGEIALSCEQEGAFLRCSVRDTGVGIPPEDLPRIFDKFHQVRMKRATKAKGTGLGLTIVKFLVEAHGGCVWAESTPGQGATFTFTVPVVDQPGEGENVRYAGTREEDLEVRPD